MLERARSVRQRIIDAAKRRRQQLEELSPEERARQLFSELQRIEMLADVSESTARDTGRPQRPPPIAGTRYTG